MYVQRLSLGPARTPREIKILIAGGLSLLFLRLTEGQDEASFSGKLADEVYKQ
jgi:hypothetical protein